MNSKNEIQLSEKKSPLKIVSSLYFKVTVVTLILFICVFVILKYQSGTQPQSISEEAAQGIEKKFGDIKSQAQGIAFSIPNALYASDSRDGFLEKIKDKEPLIQKLESLMLKLRPEILAQGSSLDEREKALFKFYDFLDGNIKKMDAAIHSIFKTKSSDDISLYIKELITISQKFSNFSPPKSSGAQQNISQFSLKGKN